MNKEVATLFSVEPLPLDAPMFNKQCSMPSTVSEALSKAIVTDYGHNGRLRSSWPMTHWLKLRSLCKPQKFNKI
jgi:hypothetical protein